MARKITSCKINEGLKISYLFIFLNAKIMERADSVMWHLQQSSLKSPRLS